MVIREVCSLTFFLRIFSMLKYVENLALDYLVHRAVLDFSSTMLWLTIVLHWQACMHWLFPVAVASLYTRKRPSNDSWINSVELWDQSESWKFYHCILRSISSFFRAGFLVRTEPKTPEDQFLVITYFGSNKKIT